MQTLQEVDCTETVPSCGQTCSKVLPCRHFCEERCCTFPEHCRVMVLKQCACGAHDRLLPCSESFRCVPSKQDHCRDSLGDWRKHSKVHIPCGLVNADARAQQQSNGHLPPSRCEKRCNKVKSCLRHQCKRRCCGGTEGCQECTETCSRKLSCGHHLCPVGTKPPPILPQSFH